MAVREIPLGKLIAESTTQPRDIASALVREYAEALKDGAVFPPVVGFADADGDVYLADGFHRRAAFLEAGVETIQCDLQKSADEAPQRAAILYAVQANAAHGQRRSNKDKQRAVEMLLTDRVWNTWTDREIARQCRVHHKMVGRQREKMINAAALQKNGAGAIVEKKSKKNKGKKKRKFKTSTGKTATRTVEDKAPQAATDFEARCRSIANIKTHPATHAAEYREHVDRQVVEAARQFLTDWLAA